MSPDVWHGSGLPVPCRRTFAPGSALRSLRAGGASPSWLRLPARPAPMARATPRGMRDDGARMVNRCSTHKGHGWADVAPANPSGPSAASNGRYACSGLHVPHRRTFATGSALRSLRAGGASPSWLRLPARPALGARAAPRRGSGNGRLEGGRARRGEPRLHHRRAQGGRGHGWPCRREVSARPAASRCRSRTAGCCRDRGTRDSC